MPLAGELRGQAIVEPGSQRRELPLRIVESRPENTGPATARETPPARRA